MRCLRSSGRKWLYIVNGRKWEGPGQNWLFGPPCKILLVSVVSLVKISLSNSLHVYNIKSGELIRKVIIHVPPSIIFPSSLHCFLWACYLETREKLLVEGRRVCSLPRCGETSIYTFFLLLWLLLFLDRFSFSDPPGRTHLQMKQLKEKLHLRGWWVRTHSLWCAFC